MSDKFTLMHNAIELAQTATDAMKADGTGAPDETSWTLAENILGEAKRILPDDPIVGKLNLTSRLWVSIRSAMQATATRLQESNREDNRKAAARVNRGGTWS